MELVPNAHFLIMAAQTGHFRNDSLASTSFLIDSFETLVYTSVEHEGALKTRRASSQTTRWQEV